MKLLKLFLSSIVLCAPPLKNIIGKAGLTDTLQTPNIQAKSNPVFKTSSGLRKNPPIESAPFPNAVIGRNDESITGSVQVHINTKPLQLKDFLMMKDDEFSNLIQDKNIGFMYQRRHAHNNAFYAKNFFF